MRDESLVRSEREHRLLDLLHVDLELRGDVLVLVDHGVDDGVQRGDGAVLELVLVALGPPADLPQVVALPVPDGDAGSAGRGRR